MTLNLTFKEVCQLIKKDSEQEPALIEAVDKLLGLALVCSPLVASPALVTVLPALGVKNELIKVGKYVFERLAKKKDEDYVGRQERMQMAYGLVVFTAFFDALDLQLPKDLRERIGSLDPHKAFLVKEAARKTGKAEALITVCERADAPLANVHFAFPHPTEALSQQIDRHQQIWKEMARGFTEFVQRLAFWEQEDDREKSNIISAIQKVPEEAPRFFEAQYFELARTFEDFAVWANLQEHTKTKQLIRELSEYVRQYAKLSQAADKAIDIGFAKLHTAVVDIPEILKISQAKELVDSLTREYRARVSDPIIEDKEEPQENKPRLAFPLIRDAFIPQSFRVLRQSGKGRRLEDEETWNDLPRRNDLGAFLLSYLSSPYSIETPLLILGHPGSGKSPLTTVLASQLMSKHITAIRVPLREVNAESGIVTQIEEAIRRITNISVDSWAKLTGDFKNSPLLVILDGYDELLQASGKVFAGYLKDVQHFQKNEAVQGRPVRVIVTSRVTLIDKATVPSGTTIIRLLEFDENQRERWISIWNKANINYFREAQVEEFGLPDKKESGAEKILALAEQPLLLLMLALYDSQGNQLRKSKGLDRTKLYDSLLRRFVTRERGKEKGFDDTEPLEKKRVLDVEMQRLGVAALGMYNRRKVHVLAPELNDDLKFFNLERLVQVTDGRPLSEADLLLGSFFFIHKSKAQHAAGAPETHEETSAFEFLHNTFGEFLTADFILRRTLAEVEALQAFQKSEALREDLEKRLNDADGFKREWFASLVYTPLFTRPVVLEMMREWINHILRERHLSREDFLATLDMMILNQIKRLLNKREMPSIICKETAQEGYRALFGDHPLLGHIAIYSINLILLRVLVSERPFVFDESRIEKHEDGARPWDRLAHIWRSWFSLDNLNGITAVMFADRKGSEITISAKTKFQVAESQNRLETCLNVGISLGDNISTGLTGLILFEPSKENQLSIDDISQRLASENMDPQLTISLKRLLQLECSLDDESAPEFFYEIGKSFEIALRDYKTEELERIARSLQRAVQRLGLADIRRPYSGRAFEIMRHSIDPNLAAEVAARNPQAGLFLWQVAKDVVDKEWSFRFAREFVEFSFRRLHPMEVMGRSPETWAAWLQLIREIGSGNFKELYRGKFFPEFFDSALDPRYFIDLSERNPAAALSWLQLAREFGGERFFRHFEPDLFDRAFSSHDLIDLSERNPELGLAWAQLALEVGGERFLKRLDPRLLHRVSDPDFLAELIDRNPQAALNWIQVARSLGGKRFLKQKGSQILERVFHPRRLFELADQTPDAVLTWIELAREVGRENLPRLGREFFERAAHPRQLWELSERSPEVALMWIQLMQELGGSRFLEGAGDELFEQTVDSHVLTRLLRTKPAVFAFALRFARITGSKQGIDAMIESLTAAFNKSRHTLSTLPISAMPDLKWLVDQSGNPNLYTALRDVLNETSNQEFGDL